MSVRVVVQRQAARDAERIISWLRERSHDGAESWRIAYESAVLRLRRNPIGYGIAPDCEELGVLAVRQFLFKTRRGRVYRGLFVVDGSVVRVLRVRGPGQPPLTSDQLS